MHQTFHLNILLYFLIFQKVNSTFFELSRLDIISSNPDNVKMIKQKTKYVYLNRADVLKTLLEFSSATKLMNTLNNLSENFRTRFIIFFRAFYSG
jgi:hypothetical protein